MKESNSQKTVSDLLSNPIVMGIGAIAFIPDIIPVAIGAFVGYIISKTKGKNEPNQHSRSTKASK